MNEEGEMTDLERLARAVCGTTAAGFCCTVGGDLGCKVGRGEAFNGTNCVATPVQLMLSGHTDTASAVLNALLPPSEAQIDAGCDAVEATLREQMPDRFEDARSWREIGIKKPEELAQIRAFVAAALTAAIHSILGKEPL